MPLREPDTIVVEIPCRHTIDGGNAAVAQTLVHHLAAETDILGAARPDILPVHDIVDDQGQHVLRGVVPAGREHDQVLAQFGVVDHPGIPGREHRVDQAGRAASRPLTFPDRPVDEAP